MGRSVPSPAEWGIWGSIVREALPPDIEVLKAPCGVKHGKGVRILLGELTTLPQIPYTAGEGTSPIATQLCAFDTSISETFILLQIWFDVQ